MHALIYCLDGVGCIERDLVCGSMGEVCWCVIIYELLAGCSCFCGPGRAAGCVCLGVFPTWCSKAGADTGSICNRMSFNGHVFYFKLRGVL